MRAILLLIEYLHYILLVNFVRLQLIDNVSTRYRAYRHSRACSISIHASH